MPKRFQLKFKLIFLQLFVGGLYSTCNLFGNKLIHEKIIEKWSVIHKLTPEQASGVLKILQRIPAPAGGSNTHHPVTSETCLAERTPQDWKGQDGCSRPYMVPIVPGSSTCIDQFEFPNIPCDYPMVWARAKDAFDIRHAMGKRLCDAHEWEGSCAGELSANPYVFDVAHKVQREQINRSRKTVWSYGDKQDHSMCATSSKKSPGCDAALASGKGVVQACGSNTFPSGYYPKCRSITGVFDLHGNAAEHMNLPLNPQQLTSRGGSGFTEMKGSWFVFQTLNAHKDDCFWRAPDWHISKVEVKRSHQNYHLGFRCCSGGL